MVNRRNNFGGVESLRGMADTGGGQVGHRNSASPKIAKDFLVFGESHLYVLSAHD